MALLGAMLAGDGEAGEEEVEASLDLLLSSQSGVKKWPSLGSNTRVTARLTFLQVLES